jgi:hypothetical protein
VNICIEQAGEDVVLEFGWSVALEDILGIFD